MRCSHANLAPREARRLLCFPAKWEASTMDLGICSLFSSINLQITNAFRQSGKTAGLHLTSIALA